MSATPCTKRHACKSSAAMPGVNTHTLYGWEMEHYFYDQMDTEEDFFKSTAPSEDIWKKFELLPTPPMSPSRTLDGDLLLSLPGDRLGWAPPKVLTCDDEYEGLHKFDPLDIFGNLGSIVIKDCMWSGFSTSQRLEKAQMTAQVQTSTSQHPQKGLRAAPGTPVSGPQAAQCVNPAAVLELPVPHNKKVTAGSSGSECRSDSSDDDEEEEEDDDDDDEIDVVSVDSRPKRGRPPSRRTPVTITVSADPFGPCPKRFHVSLHRQQHNYAAPSPDTDPEEDDFDEVESVSKRPRLELPSPLSSPATSDSEDSNEQRRNFLERKRRDDLRSRFQALREEIPGLSGSSKTSKVAILTHATEYLLKLHACQRRQAQEKRKLKAKRQQLLRRISVLQNS